MRRHAVHWIPLLLSVAAIGCAEHAPVPSGTVVPRSVTYADDPTPEDPALLLFAYIPPSYLADNAEYFADAGVRGVMVGRIMDNWRTDVWRQPMTFTPDQPEGRVVGEENPLLQMCRAMNARCDSVGIRYNSVKTSFSGYLPDWYDDAGWAELCENHRQCAIFARDAGFAGISLDIEYVSERYALDFEEYLVPGYNRTDMRAMARRRGSELMAAMLDEFPEMQLWQLPEGVQGYGPLAADLFAGMVGAMSARDASGGYHLSTEGIYYNPSPFDVLKHYSTVKRSVDSTLGALPDGEALAWWNRNGSYNLGMYPLGFYREIVDEKLNFLGYGGRYDIYGDEIVGSYADKAGSNYSPADFRRQVGAVRLLDQPFMWVYCHGSVLWRMTLDEMRRYHGTRSDTMPVADDLDEFLSVLRDRQVLDDPLYADAFASVTERGEAPSYPGFAPTWRHLGPFPCRSGAEFTRQHFPENSVVLDAAYPEFEGFDTPSDSLGWNRADVDSTAYVDLKSLVSRQDTVLAYSTASVRVSGPTTAYLHFGHNDYGAVFVNSEKLYEVVEEGTAYLDGDVFVVNLRAGTTRILVKTGDVGGSGFGFYLRILDADGREIPGLVWGE